MDFNLLAVLFIVFSIGSSLIAKWRDRQAEDSRPLRRRDAPVAPEKPQAEETDLSEWEVFGDLRPTPVPREKTELPRSLEEEFLEVKGKRSVSESYSGEEFREADINRDIPEETAGEEFREANVTRRISEEPTGPEYRRLSIRKALVEERVARVERRGARGRKSKKRSIRLPRSARGLKEAIVYSEILGPPRSEKMPW